MDDVDVIFLHGPDEAYIVGTVPGSPPQEYLAQIDAQRLDEYMSDHPKQAYYLKVVGMSMRGAGILHGDVVTIDPIMEPTAGRVVLARIDKNRFTIKRWLPPYLVSDSGRTRYIITADSEIEIKGVVTAVTHRF